MSAGPGDQPQQPPAESQPAQAPPAKESTSPPPPSSAGQHADTDHEPRRHADAPASSSSQSSAATTGLPSIGASATQPAAPPQGIHVVQPSTYLGTYVRPRGLAERPMTPSTMLAAAEPPPLSLVDREQIEGLVSGFFPFQCLRDDTNKREGSMVGALYLTLSYILACCGAIFTQRYESHLLT
jgi:hypothetical protein